MPLRTFRERLAKLLDQTRDAAQQRIPAENIVNQARGIILPPGGPAGVGYPPAPHTTDWADVTSTPTTRSGYGITDAAANTESYLVLSLSGGLTSERRLVAGTGITLTDGGAGGDLTIAAPGGSGTVTSVDITAPAAGITATGGPVTTSGAITLALANDLAALEGLSSTGLAARIAADTWAQRTIVGTANRLSVSNGSGMLGNPTLDIDAAYVGQASITTLGTIGTGVWQGTKVGLAYGGTNADLSATGGANQFLKQSSVGAAITVGALVSGDIPDLSATYQILDADLTAIAGLSATGLAARTAANTWAQRTIAGTASRLSVTNGDGVSGNPTLDIDAAYVGQASITTLGTIGTGTWQGTAIDAAHGGTGQGSYAVGDLLYASGATALSKLADVATGNVLLSGGVTTAPAWGKVDLTAHVTGVLPAANGGTGVNNSTRTLTVNTNSGILDFTAASKTLSIAQSLTLDGTSGKALTLTGSLTVSLDTTISGGGTLALAGFTLTAPATGTAALRGTANTFSATQTIAATLDAQQLTRARVTSGTTGYGIRFWDGTTDYGNFQSLDLGGVSYLFFATNRQFDGTNWQQLNTRVAGDLQITGDLLTYNTFPTSSSTPVQQLSIGTAGLLNTRLGFSVAGNQVVGVRATGWNAPTGTLTRGTFAVVGATTASTAQALAALLTDLINHGIIGT